MTNMTWPLKKENISFNNTTSFLSSYKHNIEIPIHNHPGSFGFIRKNHIHEGIDLYAEEGDEVFCIFSGVVVNILPFTGTIAGSSWWNNTYCVLIESENEVLNYGEIIPSNQLSIGQNVCSGDSIGFITPVLIKNKGRPMNMLHLECYDKGTKEPIKEWSLNTPKPSHLKDPTTIIKKLSNM